MDQLLQLLAWVIVRFGQLIQPFLVPLCFITAWVVVVLAVWNLVAAARQGISSAQKMHQIPCANCTYFTNSHFLKCPIHPTIALSEEAIDCPDFEPSQPAAKVKDPTRV